MALAIRQDTSYLGKDRWKWSVWLDGSSEELDDIESVRYILHATFLDPVRTVNNRSTNFRLDTTGWGTFKLHVKAVHKDGSETSLEHQLVLLYPEGMPAAS